MNPAVFFTDLRVVAGAALTACLLWGSAFPAQLAGVLSAFAGMVLGSLAPQWIRDQKTDVEPFVPDNSVRAAAGR